MIENNLYDVLVALALIVAAWFFVFMSSRRRDD